MYLATYHAMRPYELMADTKDDAHSGLREALEARWRRLGVPYEQEWHRDIRVRRIATHTLMSNGDEVDA